MTHEITNDLLYRTLMRRAERESRLLRVACRRNDRLNAHFQSLNAELDRLAEAPLRELDRLGDVVQQGERTEGRDGWQADSHGKRTASERFSDDMCGMEHEVRATGTRDELGQRSHGFSDGYGPRPRAIQSEAWSNY